MDNIYKQLHQKKLLTEQQFEFLDAIKSGKIVSLYYELRLILYLGIMLLTGGLGYFAYQNLGSMGHILAMMLIGGATGAGFYYIHKYALPFSRQEVTINHPFFDYILILTALLLIALLVYFIVYFNLVGQLINITSITSAVILFFMAYRYDSVALLAMAITASAASLGLNISPVNWIEGEWYSYKELYATAILVGALFFVVGHLSARKDFKKHFKFTYQNFGLILFFLGSIVGLTVSDNEFFYALLMLISGGLLSVNSWLKKEFLFFLYANIVAYIAITYLFFKLISSAGSNSDAFFLLIYYFPVTCILYIIFLVNKKSHFAND